MTYDPRKDSSVHYYDYGDIGGKAAEPYDNDTACVFCDKTHDEVVAMAEGTDGTLICYDCAKEAIEVMINPEE